ncbi:hypothetical protein AO278_03965 [Pseudomonas syringae pv. syringae]|nr:hypothetical protein AO278_03965 [Pseudomonas syringae pv. syringae]
MTAHAVVHYAPDDEVVTLQDVLGRVGTIFGLKFDTPTHHEEPLANRFRIIKHCHNDLSMLGSATAINDDQILIKNTCPNHAVSENFRQVDMRCPYLGQFVQRHVLLDVIDSGRSKPSWHLK